LGRIWLAIRSFFSILFYGSLPDDVLREEVTTRSELTKVAKPPSIGAVFDYSITRKNYAQLKAAGWQPAR